MLFLCVNVYCHRVTTQLQLINIIRSSEPCEHAGPRDWQAGYSHEKRIFSGGKGDSNTLLSGNRQVIHALLIFCHCNCMLAPMIFGF